MIAVFDLVMNVVFGSAFVLCIKWAQRLKNADPLVAGPINYIVAGILMVPFAWGDFSQGDHRWALTLGGTMGLCYFIAFFFVDIAIRWVGAAATTAVTVLSITLPIVVGVFLWKVYPNQIQVVGIVLSMLSLGLIGGAKKKDGKEDLEIRTEETFASNNTRWQIDPTQKTWAIPAILIIFFLLAGMARLAQDAFKHMCQNSEQHLYLTSAFCLAAIPSIAFLLWRRKPVRWVDVGIGTLMGVSNLLQTFFILRALKNLEGFIVFPVSSAGGLMLITLIAVLFMGERIGKKTIGGIILAIIAMCLLNFKTVGVS